MAKSIIYYQKGRREFLDQLYQNGIFGLTASIDNKEQAVFIASAFFCYTFLWKKADVCQRQID